MSITVSKWESHGGGWRVEVLIDDSPKKLLVWAVHTRKEAELLERALKETLGVVHELAVRQVTQALKLRKTLQDLNREGKDAV